MEKNLLVTVETESSGCGCCAGEAATAGTTAAVVDPVCGMTVDPAAAKGSSTHQGQTYYFCAAGCQRAFDSDPASFVTPAS